MNGTRTSRLRLVVAVAALLLLASAVPASADHGWHHERGARMVAPPLLPAPPRLPRLSHARALVAPPMMYRHQRPAYSPYFAGRVYYEPYRRFLDVYYFPVAIGGEIVYRPYYYCDDRLFFGLQGSTPHFFFRLSF